MKSSEFRGDWLVLAEYSRLIGLEFHRKTIDQDHKIYGSIGQVVLICPYYCLAFGLLVQLNAPVSQGSSNTANVWSSRRISLIIVHCFIVWVDNTMTPVSGDA